MFLESRRQAFSQIKRILTVVVLLCFAGNSLLPSIGFAQVALNLPAVGTMVKVSEPFSPAIIKGLRIDPKHPLKFNFIIDTGHSRLTGDALKRESNKLIRYFLSALTVPDEELWVNLSPVEKDRIIADSLAATEMGRDMLAQDYLLKQITASLVYPEGELGKKFWAKVRQMAQEKFGTTDVPVDSFNKVWIVPQDALIYEHNGTAFVVENRLKVMLEEDYLALERGIPGSQNPNGPVEQVSGDLGAGARKEVNALGSQIVREIVLPELEKDVNTGKNFSNLRQIANAVVLAWWYKQNLKESLLGKVYVDQNKVKGIDLAEKGTKLKIYDQYLKALKVGVYNYIKEDYDPVAKETLPRKYFSGGSELDYEGKVREVRGALEAGDQARVEAGLTPAGTVVDAAAVLVENASDLAAVSGAATPTVVIPAGSREQDLAQTGVKISFGTSGWRGKNGGDFVLENILRAAQGTASYVIESGKKKVIVGFDTREGNPGFSRETAALLAANGIQAIYVNAAATPTPALALLAQQLAETDPDFGGVINFTASHSPAQDNGFKFSPAHGGAADKAITDRITVLANGATTFRTMDYEQAKAEGLILEITPQQVIETYKNYAVGTLKTTTDKNGVSAWDSIVNYFKTNPAKRIVLDPMQGTSVDYLRAIYSEIAKDVGRDDLITLINTNNTDPKFLDVNGRPQPDAKDSHKNLLDEVTKNQGNALGISTDGDADRFGFIDFNGKFTSADDLIGLLAYFLKGDVGLDGAIGKTVVTSDFSNRVAEYLNSPIDEMPVGFKWFVEQAAKYGQRYAVAGEESAHVMVGPFAKTWDDGIAVGLTVLWMVARSGKTLGEYKENVEKLLDVRYLTTVKTIRDDARGEEMKKELGVKIQSVRDALGGRSFGELSAEEKAAVPFVILIESATGMKVEDIVLKDGAKFVMSGGSVAMRPSGTEPAVKVYVQAKQVLSQDVDGALANRNKDLLETVGKSVLNAESVPAVPAVEATPVEEDGDLAQQSTVTNRMLTQPVGDFLAEKGEAVRVGDHLHMVLRSDSPSSRDFTKGGFDQPGYGVSAGAVNDGSHALGQEGNQGYFVDRTIIVDAQGNALSGNQVFVGTTRKMADFFKRRAERNGEPIRLIIKTGIGGQHTPFQGIASVFQAVDSTTGLIVGEYELGKDFEAAITEMLASLNADWTQVAVIPSSKSGSTDETMTVFVEILKVLLNKVAALNGMNGPVFAQGVLDYLHSINFENGQEVSQSDLFRKFEFMRLFFQLQSADSNVTAVRFRRTIATVLGNMFFETTDKPTESRLAAFVLRSGLGRELGEDAPGFGPMFENVGGRWTGDLHMMTFLAFYGLDAQSYWQVRREGIEQVRQGMHMGNYIGDVILDFGIKKIAFVVPDELFWFGKATEQNFNESIWQKGFANLRAIPASLWEKQKRNYTDTQTALVINLTAQPIGPEFNVLNVAPVDLSNKQTLAEEMGRLFTTFYGMTYTVGTRLINRALAAASLTGNDVDMSDLTKPATRILQQNLFLRQPYVELGKSLLEVEFNALQAKQNEWIAAGRQGISPIEQAVKDVVDAASRKEAATNVAELQDAVSRITDMQTLALAIKNAALYARSQNRTFVPFIYLEGKKFQELRRQLVELGVEWVLQGTGDQHISYQQVLANPESFLPFFISFVPQEDDFAPASPAVGFVKGYLDNISPHLQRDYFARASYQALTVKRAPQGGQGIFLRMLDTEADRGSVRSAFTGAMNDAEVVKAFTTSADLGGINLNPNLFNLQIKRDGNGIALPLYDQPVESMTIDGFVPVILNVTPIDIAPLLGVAPRNDQDERQILSFHIQQ